MTPKIITGKITVDMVVGGELIEGLQDGSIIYEVRGTDTFADGYHVSRFGTLCEGEWVDDERILDKCCGIVPDELWDEKVLLDMNLDPNSQPLCRAYERWIAKNPDLPLSKLPAVPSQ